MLDVSAMEEDVLLGLFDDWAPFFGGQASRLKGTIRTPVEFEIAFCRMIESIKLSLILWRYLVNFQVLFCVFDRLLKIL